MNLQAPARVPTSGLRSRFSLVQAGLIFVGLGAALPMYLDRAELVFSPVLVAGVLLAAYGWRARPKVYGAYFAWAVIAAAFNLISATYAWKLDAIYRTGTFSLWALFLVPGLAEILREQANRRVLVSGLVLGATVFGAVAAFRMASGQPALDTRPDAVDAAILGLNRNAVNMRVVLVVAFVVAWSHFRLPRVFRWPTLALLLTWILTSGGRSGLLGIAFVAIMYGLIQPDAGRKVRTMMVVLLLGTVTVAAMQIASGEATQSTNRLLAFIQGERTKSDEARELLARKAWHIAVEHPLVGIGPKTFEGYFHPVAGEGSTRNVRRAVTSANAHNTYADALAALGFPGAIAVFAMLIAVLVRGIRRAYAFEARMASCALFGLMFVLYFHSGLGSLVFLALALVLGASADAHSEQSTEIETPTVLRGDGTSTGALAESPQPGVR